MKKNILVLVLALISVNYSFTQALEKGNVIIDPYYGFPNLGKSFAEVIIGDEFDEDIGLVPIGPAGLRAELMIADNFGLGLDFIYNSISGTGTVDSLNLDGTFNSSYDLTVYSRRFRFHLRANYHFVQDENLDAYIGLGVGSNTRSVGGKTDFPNYSLGSFTGSIIPISARFAIGTRYFFTENLGLNLELGLGGPLISGGLSLKF
ncbi:MAG: hypothetical protein AB8B74_08955 [Crocinitomicaceae bacterium]